ncbi:MAG: glucose-inhibited division protein A [Mariprofundaceae bacterium]|nr:glucose-inhibited division protein A [Mariprofundaceae bacterium]
MQQQVLGLHLPPSYEYGSWVRHAGIETAHNRLALWLVHGGRLWLTSGAPAGKTHLLHALAKEHAQMGLLTPGPETAHALLQVQAWLKQLSGYVYWVIDVAAGPVPQSTAIALFHLLERAREMNRHIVIAWRNKDLAGLPPELTSRLTAMERIGMYPPENDHDLITVLKSVADARQWTVDDATLRFMLTHLPRHLHAMIHALKELENRSLAERKRLTRTWTSKQIKHMRQQKQTVLPTTE